MSNGRAQFLLRVNRLTQHHHALVRGHTAAVRPDGLIVRQPRRIAFGMPLRSFVPLVMFLMVFKGFMLTTQGDNSYAERLVAQSKGAVHEQFAAILMRLDPVSEAIAQILAAMS